MPYSVTTLSTDRQPIRYLYHVSDIHLRNTVRHEEYRQVFQRLYTMLRKEPPGLIVVTGDIVHSKSQISPQLIIELRDFFTNICQIMPVLIIAGNHDLNLSNKNVPDTLTSILHRMNLSRLHYLKDSGFYVWNNLCFSVMSVWDYPLIRAKEFPSVASGCRKVGLLHATLHGSKISSGGGPLTSDHYKARDFDGYDAVLLGDIHLHQFMNVDRTIAYAGSLIQQSFGETLGGHGYLKWDFGAHEESLHSCIKAQLVEVPNDYGFVNVFLRGRRFQTVGLPEGHVLPKNLSLKLRILDDSPIEMVEQYLEKLREKDRNILQQVIVPYSPVVSNPGQNLPVLNREETPNLANVDYQRKLITEYLQHSGSLVHGETEEEALLKGVLEWHQFFNDQIEIGVGENFCGSWKLIKLEFENMLTFAGSHKLDFTTFNGIVGIFGPNFSGKSNLLDILLFGLYDKCSRGDRDDLLTSGFDKLMVRVTFQMGDNVYEVHRTGKLQTNGKVKIDVNFKCFENAEGEIVETDMTGENRFGTNREISQFIGSYEDFVLTSLRLQDGQIGNLIRLSNSQRKDRLVELLRLEMLDKYAKMASSELRDRKKTIEVYQRELRGLPAETELLVDLTEVVAKLAELRGEMNFLKLNIESDRVELNRLHSQIQPVDKELAKQSVEDVEEVNLSDVRSMDKELVEFRQKLGEFKDKMKPIVYGMNLNELEDYIELYQHTVETKEEELADCRVDLDELNEQIRILKETRAEYMEALVEWEEVVVMRASMEKWLDDCAANNKKLLSLKYDPKCDFCMNNVFVKDAIECRDKMEEKEEEYAVILDRAGKLEGIKSDLADIDKRLEKVMEKVTASPVTTIEEEIRTYQKELRQFREDYKNMQINDKVQSSVDGLSDKVSRLETERERLWSLWERSQKMAEIREHQQRQRDNWRYEEKIEELEEVYKRRQRESDEHDRKIVMLSRQESQLNGIKERIGELQEKIDDLRKDWLALELYSGVMGKDGLPKYLISKYLPEFERVVNLILEDLVNFRIKMEICEKKWNIHVIYDDVQRNVDLCSGYEKFVIDLATKVALQHLSQSSRPQFMVIDEGFGSLDGKNLGGISKLFNYLRSKFDFVLLITHIDAIKDEVDRHLEVRKTAGGSKVETSRRLIGPKRKLEIKFK